MSNGSEPASARILVVEDEAMIALHLERELKKEGFAVVGPTRSVAEALALIAREGCDFALLDVRLGEETAEPIARELLARGVPYLITTGYSAEQLPSVFHDVPVLAKPISAKKLLTELRRLTRDH